MTLVNTHVDLVFLPKVKVQCSKMTWRWRRAFALALALTNRNVWGSSSRHCSAICDRSGLLVTRTLTICSIVRPEYIVHSLIKCDNDRKLFSGYDLKCFQIQRVSFQRYLSSSSSSSSSSGSVSDGGDDEYDETLSWYDIDTPEFVQLVTEYQEGKRKNVLLVDVREPEELNESGVIPGTINIPRRVHIINHL